jgi:hypothetical protein
MNQLKANLSGRDGKLLKIRGTLLVLGGVVLGNLDNIAALAPPDQAGKIRSAAAIVGACMMGAAGLIGHGDPNVEPPK